MIESGGNYPGEMKLDRRVARTRSALRDALDQLIREKGYNSVTVEEITQRAGLGRATFYLHYRDKEDLLLEGLSDLARDRVQLMAEFPLVEWDAEDSPIYLPLLLVFQNAVENASLYREVLKGEGRAQVTTRLTNIISIAIDSLMQSHGESGIPPMSQNAPLDLLASYTAGALVGALSWWLDQPGPLDAESMTRTFQRLFFPGAALVFSLQAKK
jgi:AcrR family transcriptional regulator